MTSDDTEPEASEVTGVTRGLVYIIEDRVALEVPNFGRLEFPPDVAESTGEALKKGAQLVREGKAPSGYIIL